MPTSGRSEPAGASRPERPPPIHVDRLPSSGRQLPAIVAVLIGAVVLAFLKPWDIGREPGPERAGTAATATPSSVATARSPGTRNPLGAVPCFSDREWRVVTVERLTGIDRRSWIAVDPVAATGPTDRRIPTRRLTAEQLLAIGYCAPRTGTIGTRDPELVALYRVEPGGRSPAQLPPPLLFAPTGDGTAEMYQPDPAADQRETGWKPGRYVLEVNTGTGGRNLWFALEFVAAPPPRPQGPTPR